MAADHSWQAVFNPGAAEDFFRTRRPSGPFNAASRDFEPTNAWWLSELSRLIYRRDATEGIAAASSRSDHLARARLAERRFFYHPGIQAALVESLAEDETAFAALVFRGTIGRLANWLVNFDAFPVPWPSGGNVHRGFGELIHAIWGAVEPVLETVDKPLFYTGHSLGGAMATLAAAMAAPQAVYTFGAPRIGDAAFADTLADVPIFNVFNPGDIVTHLPPSGTRTAFVHAGVVVNNSAAMASRRRIGQAPAFLAGHAPLNYTVQLPVAGNQ